MKIRIELPPAKSRNRNIGRSYHVYQKEKKKAEQDAFALVKNAIRGKKERIKYASISFVFCFDDRRRRDLDNYISSHEVKGWIDGICQALGIDDNYFNVDLSFRIELADEKKTICTIKTKSSD